MQTKIHLLTLWWFGFQLESDGLKINKATPFTATLLEQACTKPQRTNSKETIRSKYNKKEMVKKRFNESGSGVLKKA